MSSIDEIFSTFDEAFSNVPILYNGNTFNRVDDVDSVNKLKSIKRLTVTLKLVTWNYGFLTFNLKFLDQIQQRGSNPFTHPPASGPTIGAVDIYLYYEAYVITRLT